MRYAIKYDLFSEEEGHPNHSGLIAVDASNENEAAVAASSVIRATAEYTQRENQIIEIGPVIEDEGEE